MLVMLSMIFVVTVLSSMFKELTISIKSSNSFDTDAISVSNSSASITFLMDDRRSSMSFTLTSYGSKALSESKNLTHAFEVSGSIVNSLSLKPIEYMIKSDNQISIKKLAETVITQAKSSSKILPTFKSENLIDKIDHFPENIYINSLKLDFQEQIQERYNEIRKTYSF